MIAAAFLQEFKATGFDAAYDKHLQLSDRTKQDLNSIMPILNSVQLWGRYKQQFDESVEKYCLYHVAPEVGQTYVSQEGWLYRNVHWVFGYQNLDLLLKFPGAVIYRFEIPKAFRKALVDFRDSSRKLLAMPPW
jgi:hypothetical protein